MAVCALLVPHAAHEYAVYYGDFGLTRVVQTCQGIPAHGSGDPS